MCLINAYKTKFPDCKTSKVNTKQFVTQYREVIQAESAILHDSDGIRVQGQVLPRDGRSGAGRTLNKGCDNAVCHALGKPFDNKRPKNRTDRIRLQLDDHVHFQNKFIA